MQNNLVTIIVPIYQSEHNADVYLKRCIDSICDQTVSCFNVIFTIPSAKFGENSDFVKGIRNYLSETNLESEKYSFYIREGAVDYSSQVNDTVNNLVNTQFFTVLQYDDTISPKYVENILKHNEAYPKTRMFCTLVAELDPQNQFLGMSNESVWAIGTMDVFGYFDLKNTKQQKYYNFSLCGAAINTEYFKACGGFKRNFKMFGDYEFLLRFLHKGNTVFVIPHLSYKHTNGLEGSIYDLQKDMTDEERKFWHESGRKEYYFDFDRDISYQQ